MLLSFIDQDMINVYYTLKS